MNAIIKRISIPVLITLLLNLVACGGGGGSSTDGNADPRALSPPVEIEVTAVEGNQFSMRFNTFGQTGNYGDYFGVYYSLTPFTSVANENDFISFENITKTALPFAITETTTVYFLGASVATDGSRSVPSNSSAQAIFNIAPVLNNAHAQGGFSGAGGAIFLYVDFATQGNEVYISDSDFSLDTLSTAILVTATGDFYDGFTEYSFNADTTYANAPNLYVRTLNRSTFNNVTNLSVLSDAITFSPTAFIAAPTINSISVAGSLITIDFNAVQGAEYEIYNYGTSFQAAQRHDANVVKFTATSSPITIDCGANCGNIGIAQVDGVNRSIIEQENLFLVSGTAIPANIQESVSDISFSLNYSSGSTADGARIYYATSPITDIASATLLASIPRTQTSFTHSNVTPIDSAGFPVTHYYSVLPYRVSPANANVSSTGGAQTAEITSSPVSFDLAAFSNISGKLGFYNGKLTSFGRFVDSSNNIDVFGFSRYDPDLTTASSDILLSSMPSTGFLPQSASSVIYAQILNAGYRIKLYERNVTATSESIMNILADANQPQQIIEDATNVYVLVDILVGTPSIYRSAKTTTDGSYIIMNEGLSGGMLARQKIALGNNLLYYTSGNGIYSLPLDADISVTSPATPTRIIGEGMDTDNISDFVVVGTDIYYITGGVGTYGLEAGLYLSAEDGAGGRTTTTLAAGLSNATNLSFVNNQLFWNMNYRRLYTLAIDPLTGIAPVGSVVQSVVDTRFNSYTVEPVADASLGYRVYATDGQYMLELSSDYIHSVMPVPEAPVIASVLSTYSATIVLQMDANIAADYYEIYLDGAASANFNAPAATANRISISGLTVGQQYSISVKACNINGCNAVASNAMAATPTS